MENSKFNNSEELEELKLKINAYRILLTSLKSGSSIDDYHNIRNEFYNLKARISEIVYVEDTNKEGHLSDIHAHKKQIQQFTPQLTSLNQTVEEFLDVLNQLIEEAKKKNLEESPSFDTTEKIVGNIDEWISRDRKGPIPQPTYRQLKNLADGKSQLKLVNENLATKKEDNHIVNHPSHFNADYFLAINHHITNTPHYLSRHASTREEVDAQATEYLKNRDDRNNVDIQKSVDVFSPSNPLIDDSDISPNSFTNKSEHLPATIQESQSINEQTKEQQLQSIAPLIEEEGTAIETKKLKNSLFFNLFRK